MDASTNSDEPKTLTVVIKSPNQSFEDQTVEDVQLSWTVLQLKSHLSQVYPSHPPVKDQRLIYSGKLLPDHLTMKNVFWEFDTKPTLHLVCSFRSHSGSHLQTQPEIKKDLKRHSNILDSGAPPSSVSNDGLRQRGTVQTGLGPTQSVGTDSPHAGFPAFNMYTPQQLVWLQQMYARQYYMHYHAALAAAAAASTTSTPIVQSLPVIPPAPPVLADQPPVNDIPLNQNNPQPVPVNPVANPNLRMNAQGGPMMDDEEDVNRDWLDWLYTVARFSVFLSILYFYSTLSRFVMVMGAILVMYLYTARWFPIGQRPGQQDVIHPNEGDEVLPQPQENQNPDLEEEPVSPAPETTVERHSVWVTAFVFFKSFFSSLIPDGPQAIAN
uniref:Homocysteine-inducible, endoplasmic reticulum stress-inducible, ubiquitin-like domain member 1 n=1 Tax=Erpetoichthys calabaricus TaxID=27687 RepID=A0A8C4S5S2_ERPCA